MGYLASNYLPAHYFNTHYFATEGGTSPPGLDAQFGFADINVYSTTGLPVARSAFIEKSACIVTIGYFNGLGAPFVPNIVTYQVLDVISKKILVPATALIPALINKITITAAQNAMVSLTRDSEGHQVLFQITDATGNVSYALDEYDLLRVPGAV
jgi:hypothetical protein